MIFLYADISQVRWMSLKTVRRQAVGHHPTPRCFSGPQRFGLVGEQHPKRGNRCSTNNYWRRSFLGLATMAGQPQIFHHIGDQWALSTPWNVQRDLCSHTIGCAE